MVDANVVMAVPWWRSGDRGVYGVQVSVALVVRSWFGGAVFDVRGGVNLGGNVKTWWPRFAGRRTGT